MKTYDCCKDCYDRHPLCHAECPKKAEVDAQVEAIKKAKAEKLTIKGYSRDQKDKVARKRRNHRKR